MAYYSIMILKNERQKFAITALKDIVTLSPNDVVTACAMHHRDSVPFLRQLAKVPPVWE